MFHYQNLFIQRSLSQNVLWSNERVLENTSSLMVKCFLQLTERKHTNNQDVIGSIENVQAQFPSPKYSSTRDVQAAYPKAESSWNESINWSVLQFNNRPEASIWNF